MRSTAGSDEVARAGGSRARLSMLLLLAVSPVAAPQVPDGQILANIGLNATSEKAFLLRNAVDCRADTYRFLLTSDSTFVSLPVSTIELSKSESTRVLVSFDSNGLNLGTHTANITVNCRDCGRCPAGDKTLRVVLTVVADAVGIEDNTVAPPIVEPVIQVDGNEAELQPIEEGEAIRGPDVLAVDDQQPAPVSQIPAAGALVAVGTSVSLILPVEGSTSISGAWLAIIVLLVIAAILIFFWRKSTRKPAAPAVSIEVRSSLDTGTQRVWSEGNEPQCPVIRVRLRGDAAEQSVQGDPVAITEREW